MANCVNKPKIGQRVYRSFHPLNAGIIRGLGEFTRGGYFQLVDVVWKDGYSQTISTAGLRDFDSLIEDHRRKLRTHEATLDKLSQMAVDNPSLRMVV